MSDVFVSYKRDDRHVVQRIVEELRRAGLSVWWDADIAPDAPWESTIEQQLDEAGAAWAEMLVGELAIARSRVDEAIVITSRLYDSRPDFFASLIYAVALLYQGVQRFLEGERAFAGQLVERGLQIVQPFASLSVQNASLGLTVWYLRAGLAALGLGYTWQQFETESRALIAARPITPYELEYVQAVRMQLFRRHGISLPASPP